MEMKHEMENNQLKRIKISFDLKSVPYYNCTSNLITGKSLNSFFIKAKLPPSTLLVIILQVNKLHFI